jgi:hypothetical protein
MSKSKPTPKKIISAEGASIKKPLANRSRAVIKQDLVFGRPNFILFAVGLALIIIGLALMTGGQMPSPEVWDPNIIYSFRRVTLAPIFIVAGLVVEIVAIFKK